jgi:hypothetical protein
MATTGGLLAQNTAEVRRVYGGETTWKENLLLIRAWNANLAAGNI